MFQMQTSGFIAFLMAGTSGMEYLDTWHWTDAGSSVSFIKEDMYLERIALCKQELKFQGPSD